MERYKIIVGPWCYILKPGEEAKLDELGAGVVDCWVEVEPSNDGLGAPLDGQKVRLSAITSYVVVDDTDDLVAALPPADAPAEEPEDAGGLTTHNFP